MDQGSRLADLSDLADGAPESPQVGVDQMEDHVCAHMERTDDFIRPTSRFLLN